MNIEDLRIFGRVAALLNISTAAAELNMAPGTVSKKLQALEAELGTKLFDRTTRSMRITEEGRLFLQSSHAIVAAADAAVAELDDANARVRGRLKITAPKSIGGIDVIACIARFLAEHPGIEMHVDLSSRYVNLQEEGYDLAIRTGALSDSTLLARRLLDDRQVIVAAPSYLAQFGVPRRPQDLERHSCLVLGDQNHWEFKRKKAVHVARVTGRMRGNDASLLLRSAIEGCGIIRVSRAIVEHALADGHLKELLSGYDASTNAAVWAVYPNTKYVPARLRAFIDFIADWLKHHDDAGGNDSEPGSGSEPNSSPGNEGAANDGGDDDNSKLSPQAA